MSRTQLSIPLWLKSTVTISLVSALSLLHISATKDAPKVQPLSITSPAAVVAPVIVSPVKAQTELMHDYVPVTPAQTEPHTRIVWMEVTAYCPCTKCCGPNAIGLTASGKDISYNEGRFVAADTSSLPFGTKLIIPGYDSNKPVEVIDRGGAIKGNKLDVFFATHEEALQWGRRWIAVTVVE